MILTIVDDTLIGCKGENVVTRLNKLLANRFATTGMGEVSLILGMIVTRDYDRGALS